MSTILKTPKYKVVEWLKSESFVEGYTDEYFRNYLIGQYWVRFHDDDLTISSYQFEKKIDYSIDQLIDAIAEVKQWIQFVRADEIAEEEAWCVEIIAIPHDDDNSFDPYDVY